MTGIDDMLRDETRRWSAEQPAPPDLHDAVGRAVERSARRRPRVLAAAASVLVVAGVAAVPLVREASGDSGSAGGAGAATASVSQPISSPTPSQANQSGTGTTGRAPRRLVRIARRMAAGNGDRHATGEAVRTTYGPAERAVSSDDLDTTTLGKTPVWVIELHGSFTCETCKIPPGMPSPTGTVITVVVKARNFGVLGYNFGGRTIDLAQLGRVVELPL